MQAAIITRPLTQIIRSEGRLESLSFLA